jgi:4-amino-4-deoxy-L-arabinose transferase-like glycosyltransferase
VDSRTAAPAEVPVTPALARSPWVLAGLLTATLLALSTRYGPHRDELYFISAGHHPAWGYPDQPPLTPLVARLADELDHGSLLVLRAGSAVLAGVVVVLAAMVARELGGGRSAQLLAAVTTATSAGVLAVGHLLSTATLDVAVWLLVIWLVLRLLHRDEPRLWPVVGLVIGLGLQNKHLVGLLAAALVLGIVVTPELRHHVRSPWAWLGAAVALALWLPNLIWQAEHDWPQLTLAGDVRDEYQTAGGVAELLGFQLLLLSPLGAVLAGVGLVALFRRRAWRWARPVAVAYVVLLVFFLLTGGKGYYLLGLLPPLAAAGSVVVAQRWRSTKVAALAVAVAVLAVVPVPALLPLLPARTFADSPFYSGIGEDSLETIGWPRVVSTVRRAARDLPADQRARAVIVTGNYGEAGALQWYDETSSLPPVFSGHNGFGDWGPPTGDGPVLWVATWAPDGAALRGCRLLERNDTGYGNEEDGMQVWGCDGPVGSWSRAWPLIRHLDA